MINNGKVTILPLSIIFEDLAINYIAQYYQLDVTVYWFPYVLNASCMTLNPNPQYHSVEFCSTDS